MLFLGIPVHGTGSLQKALQVGLHTPNLSPSVPNAMESFQPRKAHSWPPPQAPQGQGGLIHKVHNSEVSSVKLNSKVE